MAKLDEQIESLLDTYGVMTPDTLVELLISEGHLPDVEHSEDPDPEVRRKHREGKVKQAAQPLLDDLVKAGMSYSA